MIGIEEKDMIINRIPAKTWNHLHMNQSRVGEVVINRTGELNASVNDVSLIDDGKLNNGELDNIIGGCGQEITEAAKKSQTEPVYYITDKKNAGFVRLDFNYGKSNADINVVGIETKENASIDVYMDFNGDKDGILQRAKITENGQLTERFKYLQDYVDEKQEAIATK